MQQVNQVICGDCLEVLKDFPDNSVDAIVTDPPYFKVKKEWWDRQWDKPEGFLSWLGSIAEHWQRILKPNGSLYCFASPRMAARVEVLLEERFNVLNHLVWYKGETLDHHSAASAHRTNKSDLRSYNPETERIIFCEHYEADNIAKGESGYSAKCDELRGFVFEPLRAWFETELLKSGIKKSTLKTQWMNAKNNKSEMPRHWFERNQYELPTQENYHWLQTKCPGSFLRPYEELRQEYEELRRPFAVSADVPYTDVWTFPTVSAYPGKHPCEKPAQMLEHIISASTRPGALVLDCFAGSGSTLAAAKKLGRNFIGIEIDPHWVDVCQKNLGQAQELSQQKSSPVKTAKTEQLRLGF